MLSVQSGPWVRGTRYPIWRPFSMTETYGLPYRSPDVSKKQLENDSRAVAKTLAPLKNAYRRSRTGGRPTVPLGSRIPSPTLQFRLYRMREHPRRTLQFSPEIGSS